MPALGLGHAPLAFEHERLGDDSDGEGSHLAGQGGDDGRSAGAGAATKASGDEYHVGAFEGFDDLVGVFERGLAADFGIRARAQAVGELHAELQLDRSARHAQRLQIGVGDDELNAFDSGVDHAVDRVAAAAAHADDFDFGIVVRLFIEADANAGIVFHGFHLILSCVSFAILAASLGGLCGQKLLTAKIAKNGRKGR